MDDIAASLKPCDRLIVVATMCETYCKSVRKKSADGRSRNIKNEYVRFTTRQTIWVAWCWRAEAKQRIKWLFLLLTIAFLQLVSSVLNQNVAAKGETRKRISPPKNIAFREKNISGSALAGYWRFWLLAGKDSRITFTHLRTVHLAGDFRIYCHYVEFPIFININMRTQVFANKFLAADVEFTCAENANLTLSDHNNSAFDTKCFSMAEYNVVGEGPRIVRECSKFDYSQAAYKVKLNSTK